MTIRPLYEQFEVETVGRIKTLIQLIGHLNLPRGASRLYSIELKTTLESGALLAALCMTSCLLEICIFEFFLEYKRPYGRQKVDLRAEFEDNKNHRFANKIDDLVKHNLFDEKGGEVVKRFFKSVRIPILHGLPYRFLQKNDENKLPDSFPADFKIWSLEDCIEDNAITLIEDVIQILDRNLPK